MTDFTPGPWTRESGMILDGRRNIVASRYSWRHADTDNVKRDVAISPTEADANQRLLAAAPQLLLMCEAVSKRLHIELDEGHEQFPCHALLENIDEAIRVARA